MIAAAPPNRQRQVTPEAVTSPVDARVLIVDDDPMLLRVLVDAVAKRLENAMVEACPSPLAAVEYIAAVDYDVVVSDLLMGGLHGLDLLERVKAMRPTSLVVLITGADDRDLSVRALRGGAYDFIQKPVDADYLAASIRRAIETRRLRAAVERQQAALRRHAAELEQIVAARTEELRRANRSKDELLATISHELRTPLTSILGWARLLSGGRLDADEQAMAIESIARNARSQAQLIDELLDVSRIITGKLRLDVGEVDVAAALSGALAAALPSAQAKGVEIASRVDEGLGAIPGDATRVQQVLWNLLSNAVKFTPPGGRVDVSVARRGEHHAVEVRDTGIGIEPDLLPFVFDRFQQGHALPAVRRGLGLGLVIARHLVELHGGKVTAASAGPGTGSTFTILLPCSAPEASAPVAAPAAPAAPVRGSTSRLDAAVAGRCLDGVRILVVDDEPDSRRVLRIVLEKAGAAVESAASVAEAVAAFQATRPEVLICDLRLGEEDGCDVMRQVRELSGPESEPVAAIALTGYARAEDQERALAAGFGLHLAKPGPSDLARVIARLLARGGPR